jgi:regulator of sigma E protease
VELIGQSAGRERTLVVTRHGEPRVVKVRPRPDERGVGRIGVSQQYVYREHEPGEALARSVVHTQRVAAEALGLVWSFVAGPKPLAEPPSSVAVVRQSSGAASTGLDSFLRVLVAISVALALLHLVPVPGLDGGRLLFLAIEAARGRPVSPGVETAANTVGFLAITVAILAVAVAEVRRALPSPPMESSAPASLDGGSTTGLALKADGGPSPGDAGVPPSPVVRRGGTSGSEGVSDAGRPSPDAGGATSVGPSSDGGLPASDAGVPAVPGLIPDGGDVPRDAGAADAG